MHDPIFSEAERQTLEEIILHRRDVRGNRFTQDEVPESVIDTVIQAGLHAPSVGFSQPWEFVVIRDPQTKEKIRHCFDEENEKATEMFNGEKQELYTQLKLEGILEAPVNIAVYYRPSGKHILGQTSMVEVGLYSVVCAIQNMWLMARAMNLGMGWVSILNPKKVKAVLNAPQANQLIAYLCLGYVTEFLDKPELETLHWEKRREIESTVIYEKY